MSIAATLGLSPLDHRQGMGALSAPSTGASSGNRSGVFPGGTSGGGPSDDLLVSLSSGLNSKVNPGHFVVDRGTFGPYLGYVRGTVTVTHDVANASNPRIDYVVLRVRDPDIDSNVTESAKVVILKGDPAAIPVAPTVQLTDGDLLLAAVTVPKNVNALVPDNYDTSVRRFVAARGGIRPRVAGDNTPGSYEGEYRDNLETDGLDRWSGSSWDVVATAAAWTAFTPVLYANDQAVYLGSSGYAAAAYSVRGKSLEVRYSFAGARPMNMLTGNITTRLPSGFTSSLFSLLHARLTTIDTAPGGGNNFLGYADATGGTNRLELKFPISSTSTVHDNYRVAVSSGVGGQSIPNLGSGKFADPGGLVISGTVQLA